MRKLYVCFLLMQNLLLFGQDLNMKLVDKIELSADPFFEHKFLFIDDCSVTPINIFIDKDEILDLVDLNLQSFRKENRYTVSYSFLKNLIEEEDVVFKSSLKKEGYLEAFYFLLAEAIEKKCKMELRMNNDKAHIIDKYELEKENTMEAKYSSFFIYKAGEIEILRVLNYHIIE